MGDICFYIIATAHSAQRAQRTDEAHFLGNHSLSQINYENVLHTFITAAEWLWKSEPTAWMGEQASENDCGAVMVTGSCAIPFHSFFWAFHATGPTGRRPFKVKRIAENSQQNVALLRAGRLFQQKWCARAFFSLSFLFSSLLFTLCCLCCFWFIWCALYCVLVRPVLEWTLNTVDAANTPEKFFSLMRVRKRIFRQGFLRVFFLLFRSLHFVFRLVCWKRDCWKKSAQISSAALWRRRRRRREESQRHRLCGVEIFLMPLFLCTRLSRWDWTRNETGIAPEIIYDNRMFLMAMPRSPHTIPFCSIQIILF